LCLKYFGSKSLAKSGWFQTMKLLFAGLHETTESVEGSSTMSYVFVRNGGGEFELPSDEASIVSYSQSSLSESNQNGRKKALSSSRSRRRNLKPSTFFPLFEGRGDFWANSVGFCLESKILDGEGEETRQAEKGCGCLGMTHLLFDSLFFSFLFFFFPSALCALVLKQPHFLSPFFFRFAYVIKS